MTKEKEESRKELNITLNWNEKLQSGENNRTDAEFNINNIFKRLLFSRAIYPSSKHDSPLKSLKNEKRPKIALGNQQVIAV